MPACVVRPRLKKREAEQLREELARIKAQKEADVTEEPEQTSVAPEIAEILRDHRISKAEREFFAYEAEAKRKYGEECDAVAAHYAAVVTEGIRAEPR